MKYLLSLALVTGIVGASAAQKPAAKAPEKIACAVSKETVVVADATKSKMFADYKGRRYFFCCSDCPKDFKKNPAKYAKSPSIPTPPATKR